MSPLDRREFLSAAGQAGLGGWLACELGLLPLDLLARTGRTQSIPIGPGLDPRLSWTKAPCRFCGVGCGVMVGVKDGKVQAVAGGGVRPGERGPRCSKGVTPPAPLFGGAP